MSVDAKDPGFASRLRSGLGRQRVDWLLSLTFKQPWIFPIGIAIVLFALAFAYPGLFQEQGFQIGPDLPSERAISRPRLTDACQASADQQGLAQDPEWLFRYSPTGTEGGSGLPYWIYRVLPDIFPEDFAALGFAGFEKFGLGSENEEVASETEARDGACGTDGKYYATYPLSQGLVLANTPVRLPFLKGELKFTRIALNCATCHRGAVSVNGTVRRISGMPSHSFNLWSYERYIAELGKRDGFNGEAVIAAIDARLEKAGSPPLNLAERFIYGQIVNVMKTSDKDWELQSGRNAVGVGRIDAFNAFKFSVAKLPDDDSVGPVDYPGLWNQRETVRSWHHYDGNTASSSARNRGSTVGVGASTFSVRTEVTDAVGRWLENLSSPAWPFTPPDAQQAALGENVYVKACASCHGWPEMKREKQQGRDVNTLLAIKVRPEQGDTWSRYNPRERQSATSLYMRRMALAKIDTDPGRFNVWRDNTAEEAKCLALGAAIAPEQLQQLGTALDQKTHKQACRQNPADVANAFGYQHAFWERNAFRPTLESEAYLVGPLDGIWAKAPYLHNGSVPTLRDLLRRPADRPTVFVRGRTAYNEVDVGFDPSALTPEEEKALDADRQGGGRSIYDTSMKGNHNTGHEYGTGLADADKEALLAYLKSL